MRLLFLILLLGALVYVSHDQIQQKYQQFLSGIDNEKNDFDILENSRASITYSIKNNHWTTFSIGQNNKQIRILTNANVDPDTPDDYPLGYSLTYQLVDKEGKTIYEKDYYHLTSISRFEKGGKIMTAKYYLDEQIIPADTKVIRLADQQLSEATDIRIRFNADSEKINGVNIRLYKERINRKKNKQMLWKRMNFQQKQYLSRGNVYTPDLLKRKEIRNLVTVSWAPVAPTGVIGEDFEVKTLYSYGEYKRFKGPDGSPEEVLAEGFFIRKNAHGTVVVPAPGVATINFSPLRETPLPHWTVNVSWFGQKGEQGWTKTYSINPKGESIAVASETGLLEISSNMNTVINTTFQEKNKRETSEAPGPLRSRMYLAYKTNPIEFHLSQKRGHILPIRLDLRYSLDQYPTLPPEATYTFFDKLGKTIQTGTVTLNKSASLYDYLAKEKFMDTVSEVTRNFFLIPKKADKIQIRSDKSVYVSLFNTPPLPKFTKLPEESHRYRFNQKRNRLWFPLKPYKFEYFIDNNLAQTLYLFHRPVQENIDIVEGRFSWENLVPDGDWKAIYILEEIDIKSDSRKHALFPYFQEIPVGEEFPVQLTNKAGLRYTSPLIVIHRKDTFPKKIKIIVDGKVLFHDYIAGKNWETELDSMPVGEHTMLIEPLAEMKVFVNNIKQKSGKKYRRRLVNKIENQQIRFSFEKKNKDLETIFLRYYPPDTYKDDTFLSVSIPTKGRRAVGPFKNWTFDQRVYQISKNTLQKKYEKHGASDISTGGNFLVIPLGNDLPPGSYTLSLKIKQGVSGYVSLNRITAGSFSDLNLYMEMSDLE